MNILIRGFFTLILWEEVGIKQSEKDSQSDLSGLQIFAKLMEEA